MEISNAEFIISNTDVKKCPAGRLPEYAFIGRSNVGKSSLINMLTGRKGLAMTSATPGKTMLINHFLINNGWYIVDLPGYGFAKASEDTRKTWSQLVGGYIAQRPNMVGLVIVMDARRPFMPTDEWLIEFMAGRPNVRMHWLLNKADQLKNQERRTTLRNAQKRAAEIGPHVTVQLFSGMKKEGTEELGAVLEGWLGLNAQESPKE